MKILALIAVSLFVACDVPDEVVEPITFPPIELPSPPSLPKSLPPGMTPEAICTKTCVGQGYSYGKICRCAGYSTLVCTCAHDNVACEGIQTAACTTP